MTGTRGRVVSDAVRAGIAVARAVVLLVVGSRLLRTARTQWRARLPVPDATPVVPVGTISVVVPARDEAERLPGLLASLVGQPDVSEVIVVDDQSGDRTAGVARDAGATVVTGRPLPGGWAGKTWALQQGLRAASGEWVVFADADVRFGSGAVAALVADAAVRGLDLTSVAPSFELPPGARGLHAAMLTTLVYRFGGPGAAARGRELANGQCLVARRSTLVDAGGLEPVAGYVVEDVALARWWSAAGRRVGVVGAPDLVRVEPYRTLAELWSGWGRSLGLPGVEHRARIALDACALLVALPVPVIRLLLRRADLVDAAFLGLRIATLVGTARSYRGRGWSYWSSPLFDAAATAAVGRSITRRTIRWRGRRLPVGPARTGRR